MVFNSASPSCLKCTINTLQAPKAQPLPPFLLLLRSDIRAVPCAEMNLLGFAVALGLLGATWAEVNVLRPACDSPEVEEAALVARDYLNSQHTHGYKYELNRIEEIKVHTAPDGNSTYVLEVDLLETDCHVLDPTPVDNCTVRAKHLTAIEGDCDMVLNKVAGVLTVTAFKCKTEESREDICLGCFSLLPFNHTEGLDFVQTSLTKLNNMTENVTYVLMEVGRISAQVVSGGSKYNTEFVVIEASCVNDTCVALNDPMAAPLVDANSTAAAKPAQPPHIHLGGLSPKHGLRHHKLTALHDPHTSGFLSAESSESAEVVPVAPALTVTSAPVDHHPTTDDSSSASDASASAEIHMKVKRDVPADKTHPVQACPGRVRFF
uniref:Alpha-2-HS-glycoprotein 2 n=1 Tax=Kryptolebias marmoratus TaxID=37003 RepID=A0A3Q2ZQX9_KRYMA